jgi:hypothetical protein
MTPLDQKKLDEDLANATHFDVVTELLKRGANPVAWLTTLTPGQEVTPLGFALEGRNKLALVIHMVETLATRGEIPVCTRRAGAPGEPPRAPYEGQNLFDNLARRMSLREGRMGDDILLPVMGRMEMPPGWRLAIGRAFSDLPQRHDASGLNREHLRRFAQLLAMADFEDPAGWAQALSTRVHPYETIESMVLNRDCHKSLIRIIRNAHARGVHVDDFYCAHSSTSKEYFVSTPLQVAAIRNKTSLAAELIEMGADVTRRFPDSEGACCPEYVGKSILDICKHYDNIRLEQMVSAALAKKRISETIANAQHRGTP